MSNTTTTNGQLAELLQHLDKAGIILWGLERNFWGYTEMFVYDTHTKQDTPMPEIYARMDIIKTIHQQAYKNKPVYVRQARQPHEYCLYRVCVGGTGGY